MLTWLFKTARYAFDQAMKDADQGDRGRRKWDAQISGCTTVLARDLAPGTRADILRKRGDAYYQKLYDSPFPTSDERLALLNFALADYDEAIRLNPNNALAYCGRAAVNWDNLYKGDKTRSEIGEMSTADYSEAIRLDPRLAKAFYGRAISWGETGRDKDHDKYFKDINKAIDLKSAKS
jgi:tetratricopeptide (TPR) repeat protein